MSRFIILIMGLSCGLLIATDNEDNNDQNKVIKGLQLQIEELGRREKLINQYIKSDSDNNTLHDLSNKKGILQQAIEMMERQKSELEHLKKQKRFLQEKNTILSSLLNDNKIELLTYCSKNSREAWFDLRNRE